MSSLGTPTHWNAGASLGLEVELGAGGVEALLVGGEGEVEHADALGAVASGGFAAGGAVERGGVRGSEGEEPTDWNPSASWGWWRELGTPERPGQVRTYQSRGRPCLWRWYSWSGLYCQRSRRRVWDQFSGRARMRERQAPRLGLRVRPWSRPGAWTAKVDMGMRCRSLVLNSGGFMTRAFPPRQSPASRRGRWERWICSRS